MMVLLPTPCTTMGAEALPLLAMLRLAPSVYVPAVRRIQSPGTACESAEVSPLTVLAFTVRPQPEAMGGGVGAVTVTVAVSARALPLCVAITRNVPAVWAAV